MKPKGRLFLILLFISISLHVIFYFYSFDNPVFDWIIKTHLLYDVIFTAAIIWLLELLKDRKWLIGMAWIALITGIAMTLLKKIQDDYSPFPHHQYVLYVNLLFIPIFLLYICIFFARKSTARFYLRCMTLVSLLPYLYVFFTGVLRRPDLIAWISGEQSLLLFDTILNLLLAIAVIRAPGLRRPQYADFMQ